MLGKTPSFKVSLIHFIHFSGTYLQSPFIVAELAVLETP